MPFKIKPLVEKEVKNLLRDPRIYIGIVSMIIILPAMGFIFQSAFEASMGAVANATVIVVDYDKTSLSRKLISFLEKEGLKVREYTCTIEECVKEAERLEAPAVIIVPKGFASTVENFEKANLTIYYLMRSLGTASTFTYSSVENKVEDFSRWLSDELLKEIAPNVNPQNLKDPLGIEPVTVIKGREVKTHPGIIYSSMMTTSMIAVWAPFFLTIFVAQIAATATAVENEEKTLETLLTLPVTRFEILLAKLIGSSIIALLGGAFYTVGYYFYMQSFTFGYIQEFGGAAPPISPTLESYIVTGVLIMLSMIFVTSLGVLVGALSSDVRIANSFIGYLILPVMIPAMLLMFTDVELLPLPAQLLIYALPTSYPLIAAKAMLLGEVPPIAVYGIAYSLVVTLLVIYIAGKLLAPEKLLTLQYKFMMRRTRRLRLFGR